MKDTHTHIIKSQQYHIVLDDAAQSHAYQSRISLLQEHTIQSVLQKVMDTHHLPMFLDKYDEIILDLGTISAANFEHDLAYRIEEAFHDFFKNNMLQNGRLIKGNRKQIRTSQVSKFIFFLKYGYLPWHTSSATTPLMLLESALLHHKEVLITQLKDVCKNENTRNRLITQLKDSALEHIIIAIKNEEGILINKSREKIIHYKDQYEFVDTNRMNFRNAIWEIILAYVFTETSSITNLTRFLKYVIYKIATKYSLTYKELLHKIVLGVQDQKENTRTTPLFEKTILLLHKETEKKAATFYIRDSKTDFIAHFDYFLAHNALPATSPLTSNQQFHHQIIHSLKENPTRFYKILYTYLKQKTGNARVFINRFPNQLINQIVLYADEKVFTTITGFLSQLRGQSQKHSIISNTLEELQNVHGAIAVYTYVALQKATTDIIAEFLHQLIKIGTVDESFMQLLETLSKEAPYSSHRSIRIFIKDLRIEKNNSKNVSTPPLDSIALEFSKKLHPYYNGITLLSLQQFQTILSKTLYNPSSFKLLHTLLELYTKNSHEPTKTLSIWITKQLSVLDTKEENSHYILAHAYEIAQILHINHRVLEAIKLAKNRTIGPVETEISLEPLTDINDTLPQEAYKRLVNKMIQAIFDRSQQDLYDSIRILLQTFSKEYSVPQIKLLGILKKGQKSTPTPKFIKTVLERIEEEDRHPPNETNSINYAIEYVHYFFVHGRSPWWAIDTSRSAFLQAITLVLHHHPKQFVTWFKTSKNKKGSVDILDNDTYETLIKYINPNAATSIIETKNLFILLLEKDVSALKNTQVKHYKTINYIILQNINNTQEVSIPKLLHDLIIALAAELSITKNDLYQLLLGRLKHHKNLFPNLENVISWVLSQIATPTPLISPDITKKIAKKEWSWNHWNNIIPSTGSQAIRTSLGTIYEEHPEKLKFCLKQVAFRHELLKNSSIPEQKEIMSLFFSVVERAKLHSCFEIFRILRSSLKTAQHQIIQNEFAHNTLLNIAIQSNTNWTIDRWALLFFKSISSTLDTSTTEHIIKIIPQTSTLTKQIARSVQTLALQNANTIKLERESPVLQIIEIKKETEGNFIFIKNAGLVILAPYIPTLFDRIGLLENRVFKNEACQNKALYVLQYAVTGNTEAEEHDLVLNKLICGLEIHSPIMHTPTLHLEETQLIDSLLKAIIAHWSSIGKTSVTGLRDSFLYRAGRLSIEEKKYVLQVEEKSYDMLLDRIPWSIGKLKLSWMEKLIEVIWRA